MFTLAHMSDWHATSPLVGPASELASKRILGWLSWRRKRHKHHRPEVLEAMFDDVRAQAPDAVVVTGDLTNIARPHEFAEAARALERVGTPESVFVVPGNHDAYADVAPERSWDLWARYLHADGAPPDAPAPRMADFPTLRVRGPVAFVGLCSAQPSPWFMASGRLGAQQLADLEETLHALRARGLFRVVLLHHPASDDALSPRRRLRDGDALRAVLARAGAELVLHGHRHRTWIGEVPGPDAPIPVLCPRSASDVGHRAARRAQYHLMEIDGEAGAWRVGMRVRGYQPEGGRFVDEGEREIGGR